MLSDFPDKIDWLINVFEQVICMDIRLDKETFKALASGTRVDVLKLLNQRRHMQSEIAASLGLSVPTVKEHLSALEKAGLVERHDEGRKWKYYSLTKKGKGILHPEELKIWIVLSFLVFSIAGGIMTSLRAIAPGEEVQMMAMKAESASLAMDAASEAAQAASNWPLLFGVSAVIFAVILIYLLYKSSQYKKRLGVSLTKK